MTLSGAPTNTRDPTRVTCRTLPGTRLALVSVTKMKTHNATPLYAPELALSELGWSPTQTHRYLRDVDLSASGWNDHVRGVDGPRRRQLGRDRRRYA